MKDLKRWDRIEVFWDDSYQLHGWVLISDAAVDEDDSLGHQSIGYYLAETDKQITICQSSKSNKDFRKSDDTNVNAVFSIPKSCIRKIVRR